MVAGAVSCSQALQKDALLMEASRKAGREPSHKDRQEKSKPRSKKSAANPGRH